MKFEKNHLIFYQIFFIHYLISIYYSSYMFDYQIFSQVIESLFIIFQSLFPLFLSLNIFIDWFYFCVFSLSLSMIFLKDYLKICLTEKETVRKGKQAGGVGDGKESVLPSR